MWIAFLFGSDLHARASRFYFAKKYLTMFMASGNKPGANNASEVVVPCIVFFVLAPIFVALRIWSRVRTKVGLGYDDWTILISFAISMTVSGLMMASCAYGFGQHISNLSHHNKLMTLKVFQVVLPSSHGESDQGLNPLALPSDFCPECTPLPRAWDKSIPGTCISITKNWYANAGFSIATDLVILVLPMPILYKSNIPSNQKAALMFVFALGGFVMITSIFRMQTIDLSSTSPDTTYEITSSLWTIVEENVGIICACLPMCKHILSVLMPTIFPPSARSDASNTHSSKGTFVHAGTGKNEWIPSRGGGRDELAIHLTSVKANDMNDIDNTSEEYILPTRRAPDNKRNREIHRAVDFEIRYEDTHLK
ncbi:hypothetical protein BP5796_12878 [Coleophoma crateriformis]|uniref:Rhodopsin domain-containing protein n=1 Tax=Coleophoma crateriformis TaxID=565419 RepID=A0A3D8Q4Q7_9HELO|nr:hypothetical protein BP5796_12878 [Coleophoma crateriformis]